ncbi:UNVERIFIED_ORG: hypothetical protein J2Y84_004357 [Pseudomonas reinekei]|nr:hypothetical protein [Pseudomonas reinekei]MDF9902722.1 hypothetical protein [Pseudomonas reinekei]
MVVNDYATSPAPRGALRFFASKLAPTVGELSKEIQQPQSALSSTLRNSSG